MTNYGLTEKLLEYGASLHSFVVVGGDEMEFVDRGINHVYSSNPVWTKISCDMFISYLNKSTGINYIYNSGCNEFNRHGGFLKMYEDQSLIAMRQRKLGKINYEIFRKRIADTL